MAVRTMFHLGLLGRERHAGGLPCGNAAPRNGRARPRSAPTSIGPQIRRAARYLAISSKKSTWALKKKLSLGANSSTFCPAAIAAST